MAAVMESPPKRITRARAARGTESTVKATKILTAAARAKTIPSTANSKGTSTKRKARADEADDEAADEGEEAKKPARGRPRKVADAELPSTATEVTARGRPAKRAATASSKQEPAPTKAPRGRPRKNPKPDAEAVGEENASQPTTKTLRSRTAGTKTAAKGSHPIVRKVVKFQEPDKENDGPASAKNVSTSSGMRARPTRRAPATSAHASRNGTKSTASSSAKPLSPKKVTQIPITRTDSSEDELAGGDTPLKRMQKQRPKPPSSIPISPRKPEVPTAPEDADDNTMTINNAILNPPELGTISLGSPARRPPTSPFKDSMKSPARKMGPVQFPASIIKARSAAGDGDVTSPNKTLLQSAAKRPQSPIKGLLFGTTSQAQQPSSHLKGSIFQSPAKKALPGHKPRQVSPDKIESVLIDKTPRMKTIRSSPTISNSQRSPEKLFEAEMSLEDENENEDVFTGPVGSLKFPGRLSAVLPRDTDSTEVEYEHPTLEADDVEVIRCQHQAVNDNNAATCQTLGETVVDTEQHPTANLAALTFQSSPTPTEDPGCASPAPFNPMYQLRSKDLDPCHSMNWESEDDLSPTKGIDLTTSSFTRSPSKSRRVTMGLSSLADQLDSWSPANPITSHMESEAEIAYSAVETIGGQDDEIYVALDEVATGTKVTANTFFEQEISARISLSDHTQSISGSSSKNQTMDEPILEDIMVTDEDVDLANEANERSLRDEEHSSNESPLERSFSDETSEASQEYADENQMPVDPQLPIASQLAATPVRPAPKVFNTTTKVPLKPADYSTPSPVKKISLSASRAAPRRPSGPTRSATLMSYQPARSGPTTVPRSDTTCTETCTPAKSDIWSSIGTPARTPRRDVNMEMLRGAVVFVDVHTSEGADASGIFIDLLNQMGARCVKSWNWSPDTEGTPAKCGITHVVFKDGGKRTMERVRQAKGVVHCVGVTWVLDCEKENEWLDEAPYYIDRSFVPRGGARRRKSMEPKTLANMNGTLVKSHNEGMSSTRETQFTPKTPMNRRQSTMWMHTPSDHGGNAENDEDYDWSEFLVLTPVPKTPAPEAVARYAADIPTTPSDGSLTSSPTQDHLLMRTCPPKAGKFRDFNETIGGDSYQRSNTYEDLGVETLGRDKDEHLRMRLMVARRKSLQFAPKIGSPLARAWR